MDLTSLLNSYLTPQRPSTGFERPEGESKPAYFTQGLIPVPGIEGANYSDGSKMNVWYQGKLYPAKEFYTLFGNPTREELGPTTGPVTPDMLKPQMPFNPTPIPDWSTSPVSPKQPPQTALPLPNDSLLGPYITPQSEFRKPTMGAYIPQTKRTSYRPPTSFSYTSPRSNSKFSSYFNPSKPTINNEVGNTLQKQGINY